MSVVDKDIKILLVEDNRFDAELAIISLKKNALANNLLHVNNGEDALDFVFARGQYTDRNKEHKPKMILLDLSLPTLSGFEVLKQLKSNAVTRSIPVVILTSSNYEEDMCTGFAMGANSYIVKPVEFESFKETIARLASYWLCLNESN